MKIRFCLIPLSSYPKIAPSGVVGIDVLIPKRKVSIQYRFWIINDLVTAVNVWIVFDRPWRDGAGGETRTLTVLLPSDFESDASTSSTTPA